MSRTVAGLLGECLADGGVRRVWASGDVRSPALGALPVSSVATASLAALVADAQGAVGPAPGAVLLAGAGPAGAPVLRISSRPGAVARPTVLDDPGELPAMVRAALDATGERPGCAALALVLDLTAPAPADARPLPPAHRALAVDLDLAGVGEPVIVLAGGGVVRARAVSALRRLAATGHLGVLNTWTAKGVFEWTSPHHLGTAGLQARDFELTGLADAALVVASGVDPAEAPRYRWALTEVVEVAPGELTQIADRWSRAPAASIERPLLYTELAAALAPHYAGDVPGSPAVAVLAARADLPPDGLLAADPGPAGLWVARTFPTDQVGSVAVPAVGGEGFAAAAALAASIEDRPAIAVTTEPAGRHTERILDAARSLGVRLDLRVWGPSTGVDFAHTRVLEEVAGPVIAWT